MLLCFVDCVVRCFLFFFFFKQKTAYEMRISDWSSDVCSSDLFVAVARTLSFTLAGASLNLRQSTVSEHVRKLEAACGRRLFVRDTHSVRLTIDGEAMIDRKSVV